MLMARFFAALLFVFSVVCSPISNSLEIDDSLKVTCAGIEVLGVDSQTADSVRKLSVLQVGDELLLKDAEQYTDKTIEAIKNQLISKEVYRSYMVLGDRRFYLVLDILPKGSHKALYRTIPPYALPIPKMPEELSILYDNLIHRFSDRFSKEVYHGESYSKGYIDYEDPIMHEIAVKLSVLAKKHNDDLLTIIHYSNDSDERVKAAHLLSWSQHPTNLRYIANADLLMDPNSGVRNYVARSYIYFMDRVEDKSLITNILPGYCKMVALPSHADRNKSLGCIRSILKAHPEFASAIDPLCKRNIAYIAEMSILENVGGYAKDILELMEGAQHA